MSFSPYLCVTRALVFSVVAGTLAGCGSATVEEGASAEASSDNVTESRLADSFCGSSMFLLGRTAPEKMNGAIVKHDVSGYITEINGKPVAYSYNGTPESIGGKPVVIGSLGYVESIYGRPVKLDSIGNVTRVNDKEVRYGYSARIEKIGDAPVEYDRTGDVTTIQNQPVEYVSYGLVKVTKRNRLVLCLAVYGDPPK